MARTSRSDHEIRPLLIQTGVNPNALGSAWIQAGQTQIWCSVSVEEKVPAWVPSVNGKKKGWLTAEYAMLPSATRPRGKREREKISGRTQEIQRLIGRALRAAVDLDALGERTIIVDCDVLQADGGTRTTSITGAYVALAHALACLKPQSAHLLRFPVCGLSLGLDVTGRILVDLDYAEDSSAALDLNFVLTGDGRLIEVQGTADGAPFSAEMLTQMTQIARDQSQAVFAIQRAALLSGPSNPTPGGAQRPSASELLT